MISYKRREQYSKVLSYIRTRIYMLKSILSSINGVHGRKETMEVGTKTVSDVVFSLIPF